MTDYPLRLSSATHRVAVRKPLLNDPFVLERALGVLLWVGLFVVLLNFGT
jgi:hypothetical protein